MEEVHGLCPIPECGKSLVNIINGKVYNQYEVAHIFPCNPNDFQKLNLKDVQVDGVSSKSLDNKIALCRDCHKIYDDNTTEVSYNQMLELKRKLAVELKAKKEISKVLIEDGIVKVISILASMNKDDLDKSENLEYKSLAISRKVEDYTLCSEIESKVTQYFNFVRDCFKRYAKLLRSQLTDCEQALLYYNSMSEMGMAWNRRNAPQDNAREGMGLVARFRLIKNIPGNYPFFGITPDLVYQNDINVWHDEYGKEFFEHPSFMKEGWYNYSR